MLSFDSDIVIKDRIMKNRITIRHIFWKFFRLGLTAFGGPAM